MASVRHCSTAQRLIRFTLAAAILAGGSFHFHAGEPLTAAPAAFGIEVRSAASHPNAPHHIESVKLERAPRCLECLLRRKNHVLGALEPALAAREPSTVDRFATLERAVLRRAADAGQPRGPPLL